MNQRSLLIRVPTALRAIDDHVNAPSPASLQSRDSEGAVALPLRINHLHRVLKGAVFFPLLIKIGRQFGFECKWFHARGIE